MKNFVRMAALAAAATIIATPAAAQVAPASPAQARATIVKPLTLTRVNHLDFGSIVVWGDGTVSMNRTSGALTCTAATLVCAASGTPAEFTVTGTNNRVVQINASNSTITNGTDTLNFTIDAPATVTLPNSGVGNGANFTVGGSIAVFEATSPGLYSGNMNVTVQYQ